MYQHLSAPLMQLRALKPLVLCHTNFVTMDFMANSLLALGAAPMMSRDTRELAELVRISQAVNINIGTLSPEFITNCSVIIEAAQRYNKPLILDPVGAGASLIRTQTARDLMPQMNIIRGNASEIMALWSDHAQTKGVESSASVEAAQDIAKQIAVKYGCTVVLSGPQDFVTDGQRQELLSCGSPLMTRVTGMGCALTAVIAAWHAAVPDAFEAATLATLHFGLCGNRAEEQTQAPGSFRTAFIDALYETHIS